MATSKILWTSVIRSISDGLQPGRLAALRGEFRILRARQECESSIFDSRDKRNESVPKILFLEDEKMDQEMEEE